MVDPTTTPPPPASGAHRYALIAGMVVFLLGPLCLLGLPVNEYILQMSNGQTGLIPFFAIGVVYGLVILAASAVGIAGLAKSMRAPERRKAIALSVLGLALIVPGLCCLLVVWGSFLVLPCGIFGC